MSIQDGISIKLYFTLQRYLSCPTFVPTDWQTKIERHKRLLLTTAFNKLIHNKLKFVVISTMKLLRTSGFLHLITTAR